MVFEGRNRKEWDCFKLLDLGRNNVQQIQKPAIDRIERCLEGKNIQRQVLKILRLANPDPFF